MVFWHKWEDWSRKVSMTAVNLSPIPWIFCPVMRQAVRKPCFSTWIPMGARSGKPGQAWASPCGAKPQTNEGLPPCGSCRQGQTRDHWGPVLWGLRWPPKPGACVYIYIYRIIKLAYWLDMGVFWRETETLGIQLLVLTSWYQHPGTKFMVPTCWYRDLLCTKILLVSSW